MGYKELIINDRGEEIGIQSGCTPPEVIDNGNERYSEDLLVSVRMEFQYLIQMDESADITEVLNLADYQFEEFVFNDYIDCQGSSRRNKVRRHMQSLPGGGFYQHDQTMGVSSLPAETIAADLECADGLIEEGQKCLVVEGGVTIFFEQLSNIDKSYKEYDLVLFIKKQMDDGVDIIQDERVKGLVFIQGKNLEFDRGESVVSNLIRNDEDMKPVSNSITVTGSLVIGSAMLLLLGVIVAVMKRRRTRGYAEKNPAVLEMLDREYDGEFDEETCEFEEFTPPRKKYHSGFGDASFPVGLREVRHNKGSKYVQITANTSRQGQENSTIPVRVIETSNGKYPVSIEDNGAPGQKVKLISSGWNDEIEVDRVSDKDLDFFTPTKGGKRQSRKSNSGESFFPIPLSKKREKSLSEVSQDVHYCTSATCQQCQRNSENRIKFVSSYECVEVDYASSTGNSSDKISDRTDKTLDFSKPAMHERLYGNINDTLDL